jgi:hypothetical protein
VSKEGSLCTTLDTIPDYPFIPKKIECKAGLTCKEYNDESWAQGAGVCSGTLMTMANSFFVTLTAFVVLVKKA